MKKLIQLALFAAFLFASGTMLAQNGPPKQWDKTIGGDSDDDLYRLKQIPGGGYLLGGSSWSDSSFDKSQGYFGPSFNYDYWIVKVNASGNKLWDKTFGGNNYDNLTSMEATSDGGFILGGSSVSGNTGVKSDPSKGLEDFWIVKIDSLGNKLWDKTYGGASEDILTSLKQTSDGGYILGGTSESWISGDKSQPNKGWEDYWVVKIDASGNKLWDKTFGGGGYDYFTTLQQTADGGYILGGYSNSNMGPDKSQASKGYYDYWIIKLDGSGNKLWDKTFGGSEPDHLAEVLQTSDGGYILGGHSYSPTSGDKSQSNRGASDYWVVKLDASGNKIWDKRFGGNQYDMFASLHKTADGGYILGGTSRSLATGDKTQTYVGFNGYDDYWVVKIDASGNKQWDRTLGGTDIDELHALQQTADGGYILGGSSSSMIGGDKTHPNKAGGVSYGSDYWIIKLAPNCSDLSATFNTYCSGPDLTVNIAGLYSTTVTTPSWTLTYTVNGVTHTATGSTSTFTLAQNPAVGTVYSLVSIAAGACTTALSASLTIQPAVAAPTVLPVSNCGPGQVPITATGAPVGGSYKLYDLPAGGILLGSNTTGAFTTPSILGTTTFYVVIANSAGCESPRTPVTVTIIPLPVVAVGPTQSICAAASPMQLSGFSPAGGTWSGPGVNATGLFTPATGLVGNQVLTYSVTQNGCTATANQTITVTAPPVVTVGSNDTVCATATPVQLTGFSPAGGTWSGSGVNATGLFTPSAGLGGSQTLTYSVTQNGCTVSATRVITVTIPPVVNAGPIETAFVNAGPYQLTGFSPTGGTWSGPGVNASGLFTPTTALIGTQTLTYTFIANKCTVSATKQVTVPAPPAQPTITIIAPDTLISSVIGDTYAWKFNGTLLPQTTRKIKALASGNYAVQVITTSNGPSVFSADYRFAVSGLKEDLENNLNLYPNPTSGMLTLELKNAKPYEVTVFNALGQQVLQKTVAKSDEKLQLDLSHAAKGIYLVQVKTEKQVVVKKVAVE